MILLSGTLTCSATSSCLSPKFRLNLKKKKGEFTIYDEFLCLLLRINSHFIPFNQLKSDMKE